MQPAPDLASDTAPWGLCLAGPTACGKSAVAFALAQRFPIEIISVDSAQIYRGMDIGTAKPNAAERAAVAHHLIDILDPTESYSAARFAADATRLAAEIRHRGRLPLLVGGTMLYFKALRDGISAMPGAHADVRAQIVAEAAERGWPALHQELARVDPDTAARLAPRDAQRIERALEVWRSSGRSLSEWHRLDTPRQRVQGQAGATRWPLLALEPQSRAWLHQRIEARLQAMQQAGLVREVLGLRRQAGLHLGLPAMRCVGYRQVWQALDDAENAGHAGNGSPDWFNTALASTRQLAKRQLTWLRSISDRHVVPCDIGDPFLAVQNWVRSLNCGPS